MQSMSPKRRSRAAPAVLCPAVDDLTSGDFYTFLKKKNSLGKLIFSHYHHISRHLENREVKKSDVFGEG